MIINDKKENQDYFFWELQKEPFCPLFDGPKDFLTNSLGFSNDTDNASEDIYTNNNIIPNLINEFNLDIPEKINPIDERSSESFIKTNTNTSEFFFSYEKIENILKDNIFFNLYINKIKECKEKSEIKDIDYEMNKSQKTRKAYGSNVNSKNIICKKDRGRKKAEDKDKGDHNKTSPDNIIKKLKGYFTEFLIIFVNAIINRGKFNKDKIELKSLNHKKYINKIKKAEELKFLKMTVKDYLSQDISPKYIKSKADYNRIIINKILDEQKGDEVINFVFNMTIKDWIELFTLKKSIYDFENLHVSDCEVIETKLPPISELFDEILEKNQDDIYFTKFVFYLYNYENWFEIKRGRKENKI